MNLTDFIPAGSTVFDIGAYHGEFTLACLEAGADRVIAVEPMPDAAGCLRQMFCDDLRVTVEACAVNDKLGEVELIPCKSLKSISTTQRKWQTGRFTPHTWGDPIMVPTTTLDQLIADYGLPEFIKLDVEGSESQALKGLHQAVPALSFEFTHEFIGDAFYCINLMDELGEYQYSYTLGDVVQGLDGWDDRSKFMLRLAQEIMPAPTITWGMIYARMVK